MKNYKKFINSINENVNNMDKYNPMIDYTLLDNDASDEDIIELCEKAQDFGVKSVCVMPKHVSIAAEILADSDVLVCTVISFPEGVYTLEHKESETKETIKDGADEVDMVINYKFLKKEWVDTDNDGDLPMEKFDILVEEIESLVDICHENDNKDGEPITLKVIVESGLLTEKQTIVATLACLEAGADFIKTSTGKVPVGAEINKVKIMHDVIQDNPNLLSKNMKIKASGGVRDMNDITTFGQYVDRFGMGWQSVDTLNGLETTGEGY